MADPFVAEIRIFPFNFAPKGWAFCNGQLMPISQNTALFSLLGTTYGGDGKSTFALPDMQGRAPMQAGQGPGLSLRDLGESIGTEKVGLLQSEMPLHTHMLMGQPTPANSKDPSQNVMARPVGGNIYAAPPEGSMTAMAPQALDGAGGSFEHNNMQPYLTANFCIALQGVFPPRS